VNGIQVSGSIYRAAIGAAYKIQTGANLNGTSSVSPVSAPIVSAPVAPTPTQSLNRGVVFESGAIQIHPAPGNDAASLAATKSYIDQMLRQLTSELRGGVSLTGRRRSPSLEIPTSNRSSTTTAQRTTHWTTPTPC
jgi:hypothetical protein